MARRSPVRWLAPIILAGAVALVVWTINSSLTETSSSTPTVESPSDSAKRDTTPSTKAQSPTSPPTRTTYTVRPGDFLSTVSQATGVSVDRLRELNPDVDANALRVGQKLRLAEPTDR